MKYLLTLLVLIIMVMSCRKMPDKEAEEQAAQNPGKQFCYRYRKSVYNGTYCVTYMERK